MPVDPARAKTLFLIAAELADAVQRAAFLDRECGDDSELRLRVEALLAADGEGESAEVTESSGTFVSNTPETMEATAPDQAKTHQSCELTTGGFSTEFADASDSTFAGTTGADRKSGSVGGQVIAGRYTLLDVIGEGGMGSVYRASQSQPVKRLVALKLIKTGMNSRDVLARFDAERQALAMMDHPNIARIYDGGVTEAGQPFFVMELVDGVPLTDYCDQKRLTVKDRLELFVAVCQAVQHAHQKGIIHRDLKPSNVLVTEVDGRPTPKVIDFGVAKATDVKLTEVSFADKGAIVGTPAYMSPEQADPTSMDIDTRTDVYALGVMLYELLVGSPPLDARDFKRGAILEMLRMVREVDPPRPSTKLGSSETLPNIAANRDIEPAKLSKLLKGELDWVVMKALEKDRNRRYDTANGFARDIQRYLADEVVEARPPSSGYRVKKFVKRHKGQVIAASLVSLSLVAGIVGTSAGMIRAENRRIEADAARAREAESAAGERLAREQSQQRLNQLEKANKILGDVFSDLDINAVREQGTRLELVLGDRLKQAAGQLKGDAIGDKLEVARLQFILGRSLLSLGFTPEAIEIIKPSYESFRDSLGLSEEESQRSLEALALAYQNNEQVDEAIPLFEISLKESRKTLGAEHPGTIVTMGNLGDAYRQAGDPEKGVKLLEEALKLSIARNGPDSVHTMNTMNQLAVTYLALGKNDLGLPLLEKTLKLRRAEFGADHPKTLTSVNNLAAVYMRSGKSQDAEPLFEELVSSRKRVLGPEHPNSLISMNNLGITYQANGKLEAARNAFAEAMAIVRKTYGDKHPDTLYTLTNFAAYYMNTKEYKAAAEMYRENLNAVRENSGKDSINYAGAAVQLGNALLLDQRSAEAETVLRESLAIREKTQPDAWSTFNTRSLLGGALLDQKKYAEAEPLLLASYEGLKDREQTIPPPAGDRITDALDRLIELYSATGKPDALKMWQAERTKYPSPEPIPPERK